MTQPLEARLAQAVAGSPLATRFPITAAPFLERRAGDPAAQRLEGRALLGLARLLASQPKMAGFLSHRPALFERIARADAGALACRQSELPSSPPEAKPDDLEGALDALRILRREETCFAACLDLGGAFDFEAVSEFLSVLAETIAQQALALAQHSADRSTARPFAVIGMGKIAGREFTYHSDLDLIFLHGGGPDDVTGASRIGQRLIAYLTTMTGAGVAYAVDSRLRPSGQQGALVTSFEQFERYQLEQAETWEHLALLRARAIAGAVEPAQTVLDRVRALLPGRAGSPWAYLASLRRRVEAERAGQSMEAIPLKTGSGGLMDVDFLAGGALLERASPRPPALPSAAAMLRQVTSGTRVDELLSDYRFLRIVEARARWVAGRGVEELRTSGESLAVVAELVEPGLAANALLERTAAVRSRIRGAYQAVIEAGSIAALER